MQRFCYRGQYHNDTVFDFIRNAKPHIEQLVLDGQLYTLTVFSFENQNLFIYGEAVANVPSYTELFPGIDAFMQLWPGEASPRAFIPMTDVYHSYQPADGEPWRCGAPAQPHSKVSLMKLETLSSYIFLHYQLQEEQPGANGHHLSIWLSEHIALLYEEFPDAAPAAPHSGKLSTSNTPADWGGAMLPHFNSFEDGKLYHDTDIVLTVTK